MGDGRAGSALASRGAAARHDVRWFRSNQPNQPVLGHAGAFVKRPDVRQVAQCMAFRWAPALHV